ncbi:head-to-tail adaptor [Arthrobacter phage BruhMoment]|nr:head-to-tail adaptor [Arthrobacter phage BruhMoment]
MTWPVRWPAAANIENVEEFPKRIAELYATTSLSALTLGRVGGNPVTIVPGSLPRRHGWCGLYGVLTDFWPTLNPSAYDLQRYDDYFRTEAVVLPGPIGAVLEVRVAGAVLDPSAWRVEDGQYLIRTDGHDWPHDMSGAFTVSYLNSYEADDLAQHAAGVLALEFLKLITGTKGCRLPSSVTNVNRQGLTFEVARGMFPDGLTGLPEVDAFILLWNPHGLKTAPRVYTPDVQRPRQVMFP